MAQSIDRAIDLINLAAERPLSLTEAAQVLDVHKSTALRILQTLEARRFVRKTRTGSYVVGGGLIELAQRALGAMDIRQLAGVHLRELQRKTGMTVHLAQLTGDEIIYIDKVDGPALEGFQLQSRIGRPVSLYASGVGKTILAYLPKEESDRLLDGVELVQHTAATRASRTLLQSDFEQIRARGWATDDGELLDFVNCIAVPVKDPSGEVVAALSVTTLKTLTPLSKLIDYLPELLETARAISTEIGYTTASFPEASVRSASR